MPGSGITVKWYLDGVEISTETDDVTTLDAAATYVLRVRVESDSEVFFEDERPLQAAGAKLVAEGTADATGGFIEVTADNFYSENMAVDVPPGAVDTATDVRVYEVPFDPPAGEVGNFRRSTWLLEPAATTFDEPLTVTFPLPLDPDIPCEQQLEDVRLYAYEEGEAPAEEATSESEGEPAPHMGPARSG